MASTVLSLDVNLDQWTSRNAIVGALPLAFDLHAALRRWRAEAMIDSRQRAFIDFGQDLHRDRHFLVSGRVRRRIGLAAGQFIHRRRGRIHWHVELLVVYAIGDQGANADLSVARAQLDARAALNAALFRQLG